MVGYRVQEVSDEILSCIELDKGFETNSNPLLNFGFYEFDLKDLGLPDPNTLLKSVLNVEQRVGLIGWRYDGKESQFYKGFSLSYNPNFVDPAESIYHQTWGATKLKQTYGRVFGKGDLGESKNTYYDSYAFRKIAPVIQEELGYLLENFSMPLLRSRVAWNFGFGQGSTKEENWHVDELPYQLMRINIPLQTSKEHVMDIVGTDEHGNSLNIINKHLEVGKAYFWNTRIPHRITFKQICITRQPRIHIVLGFSPWYDYDHEQDMFVKSKYWGIPISEIVEKRLYLK